MRIGVDARPLTGARAGIGNYLHSLLRALAPLSGHEFVLYAHRPIDFPAPGPRWRTRVYPSLRVPGTLWLQLYAPRLLKQDGLDVFWGAHFLLPLRLARELPATVTVYDLVPVLFPRTMAWTNYAVMRLFLRPSLRRAEHVMTISQSVADDLERVMGIPAARVTVVPPGLRNEFGPRDREEARARTRDRWELSRPYLLTVGTVEPRKNLTTLLRALGRLPRRFRDRYHLLVAGAPGWRTSALGALAAPLVQDGTLRFLGYVPDAVMPDLYAGAELFVYPSLYEGFGIPVAEAMACGVPVVASDIPALHEVAGKAAEYVAPTDESAWAGALERILGDQAQQESMRGLGLQRVRAFSYDRSARRVLTILEELGSRAGR